jgi:FtsH-binding integral membrane protein
LIFLSIEGFSQYPRLGENASISVVTIGPSQEELYSAFGHSAIRIYDSLSQLDVFFNYGVFNFNEPNFYLKFTRGNLNYMVQAYEYSDYLHYYIEHRRFVHEQILSLTIEQKQKISDFLFWNVRPENQYYRYDYFYNNCATKVRDVFTQGLKDEVFFDSTYIKTNYTIRHLTDLYLGQQPWGDLGIDICLGLPMDKKASPYEYMFLPDYIESSFAHATNKITGGSLVKRNVWVYQPEKEKIPFQWFHPWIVFGAAFVMLAVVTWFDWQKKKLSKWLDIILFFTLGIIGILLLFLWTLTDHRAAANNFNLLWAVPTHVIVAVVLMRKNKPTWIKKYFLGTTILTVALLGFWYLLPQSLNVFLIPVVGIILMRAVINYLTQELPNDSAI